ncbi:hypothetical protein [Streptomyces neyagawaensis]|uniref:Uncharacterized protein n=1 Tax=Streptomyces neyagawaensis TaxID=42238 RepID=A0ABV3AZ90_9ACTN
MPCVSVAQATDVRTPTPLSEEQALDKPHDQAERQPLPEGSHGGMQNARRTKAERASPSRPVSSPLLTQREIETYCGVSTWQIDQWRKAGMPDEPFAGQGRQYDLAKCQAARPQRDGRRVTREERRAILGDATIAAIRKHIQAAPAPTPELVEELRRIMTRPGGDVPAPRLQAEGRAASA